MRKTSFFALAVILNAAAAFPAAADMDYHCLNSCVSSGKPSSTCMTQCSYGAQTPASRSLSLYTPVKSPHDQFAPPVPSDQIILHPRTGQAAPGKDYACVTQCQQGGHPYQFCDEQCTDVTTPPGTINTGTGATTNPSRLLNARPSPVTGR